MPPAFTAAATLRTAWASVPASLQQLWEELRQLLILLGQGRHIERSFTPHVTLAYSQR